MFTAKNFTIQFEGGKRTTISPLGGRCCNWALLTQTHMESWGDEEREEKEGEAGIGGLEGGETYL